MAPAAVHLLHTCVPRAHARQAQAGRCACGHELLGDFRYRGRRDHLGQKNKHNTQRRARRRAHNAGSAARTMQNAMGQTAEPISTPMSR
jgi:hypothetical protein